jgi:hypothetical protein
MRPDGLIILGVVSTRLMLLLWKGLITPVVLRLGEGLDTARSIWLLLDVSLAVLLLKGSNLEITSCALARSPRCSSTQ